MLYLQTWLFLKLVIRKVKQKLRNITHQCDEQDLQLLYNATVLNVLLV